MSNRIITFNHAKLNYDAYKKQTIPDSLECMTKSEVLNYINVDETLLSTYANNQLVPMINVVGVVQDFSEYCYYFNDTVSDIAIQPDGKIIVVGYFTKYKNVNANRIIRLNPDGSVDNTFNSGSGFSIFGSDYYGVEAKVVKLQSDGKILVGGTFDNYNGITKYSLLRLNIDGSLDSTFDSGLLFASPTNQSYYPTICNDILVFNNNIYVCGHGLNVSPNYIESAKLSMTGSLDTTFVSNVVIQEIPNTFETANSIITDGYNLFIGGELFWNDGDYTKAIKKISFNGIVDTTFSISPDGRFIKKLCYNSTNNSILYGGRNLKKMSTSGTPDVTFNSNTVLNNDFDHFINDIKVDSQGRILVASLTLPV